AKGFAPQLARDAEFALFRIVQEALANAARHSGGTCVRVSLSRDAQRVALSIEDDGKGFAELVEARAAERDGLGLPLMRERAEAVGATLHLEFPRVGSRVVVELPVRHDDPRTAG
ncbi:MAG: ATP-binding protein, partial [Burkholderiales bacterium]